MSLAYESAIPTPSLPLRQLLSSRFEFKQVVSTAERSAKQSELLADFRHRVESGCYRMVHENCPCGGDPNDLLISEVDRYGLPINSVLCLSCGTVRIDPYLDSTSLESFYRELYQDLYGRALEPASYYDRQTAYGRKIFATMIKDQSAGNRAALEVGCGAGGGLSPFVSAGFRVAGCDYSERLVEFGTQRGLPNLCVGGIEEVRKRIPDMKFDLIFLHHVYEHVGAPLSMLQELREALAPQGRILIVVPDLSRIDRFVNPAGNALDFFHIAHKYNYSVLGLCSIAKEAELVARRIFPSDRMRTAWSRSPELWIEMSQCGTTLRDVTESTVNGSTVNGSTVNGSTVNKPANMRALPGRQLWNYLHRTERLYQWGLCRAQVYQTIRSISPERLVKRLLRS